MSKAEIIAIASFSFLFFASNYEYSGANAEDSIITSILPGTNVSGYLMTVPGNLESRLTTPTSSIRGRFLNFSNQTRILSIACDQGNQTVFIHELSTTKIYRVDYFTSWLNDTRMNLTVIHPGASVVESQLSYDWLNQNLYWTDSVYKWIIVQPAYTDDLLMYKVIVNHNLNKPVAIAVDPSTGYLFWSDISPNPKIERSSLTGENRRTLISKSLKNPTSLAADEITKAIYWTDLSRNTIETCLYSGENRRVIRMITNTQLQSVAFHNDIVCASDSRNSKIICFRTSSGELTLTLSGFQSTPWALALYDSSPRSTQISPCRAMTCEHMCVTSSGGAQCMCKEGYTLNQDSKTCSAVHGLFSKGILLSNASHICMLEIRIISGFNHDISCLHIVSSGNISNLQSDGRKSLIFYAYSDSTNRYIRIHNRVTKTTAILVTTTLISGLAYDWINDYLYWSESDTGRIRGISLVTKSTFTVFDSIASPSELTIDPYNSILYWIATEVSGKVIQSGTTDGSNKGTVISGINSNNPSTIHFDTEDNRLYWSNSDSLRSCRPNGTDVTYHLSIGNSDHLFIYKKYAIRTTDRLEVRTSILSDSSTERIKSITSMESITGMTVFDAAFQRQEKSVCEVGNGGCEQVCVTNQTGRICECSLGFKLQVDQASCDSTPFEDHFLLITDNSHRKIYQISLFNKSVVALKLPILRTPVGVAYNHRSRRIIWSEIETGQIRQSTLSGENAIIIYNGFAFADRLAIDFSNGNIYFSENSLLGIGGSIRVVQNGVRPKTLIRNLKSPRAVSLYPSKGLMFYTDHATNNSHIGRSNMDGSGKTTIVSVSTKWPNGLTIDYVANRVYWTDGYHNKIESSDLNGGSRQVLAVDAGAFLMSMVLDGSYLYYTAWTKLIITKLNKNTGQQETWMSHTAEFGRLDSMDIYSRETQPVSTWCSSVNGQCSTYCLPTSSGRVCACEDGVTLTSDGRSCVGAVTCNLSIPNGSFINGCTGTLNNYCQYICETGYKVNTLYPNVLCSMPGVWTPVPSQICSRVRCSPKISNGFLHASCNRYAGEDCSYNCNSGFEKNVSIPSLSCLYDGEWDVNVEKLCEGKISSVPKTNLNITAFVGGGVGSGFVIVLIIVGLLYIKRRRNRNAEENNSIRTTNSVTRLNNPETHRIENDHYACLNRESTGSSESEHIYTIIPGDAETNDYPNDGYITPVHVSYGNNLQTFNNHAFSIHEYYPEMNT